MPGSGSGIAIAVEEKVISNSLRRTTRMTMDDLTPAEKRLLEGAMAAGLTTDRIVDQYWRPVGGPMIGVIRRAASGERFCTSDGTPVFSAGEQN
jgi:hypothetical protein